MLGGNEATNGAVSPIDPVCMLLAGINGDPGVSGTVGQPPGCALLTHTVEGGRTTVAGEVCVCVCACACMCGEGVGGRRKRGEREGNGHHSFPRLIASTCKYTS